MAKGKYAELLKEDNLMFLKGYARDGITDVTSLHGKFVTESELRDEVEREIHSS